MPWFHTRSAPKLKLKFKKSASSSSILELIELDALLQLGNLAYRDIYWALTTETDSIRHRLLLHLLAGRLAAYRFRCCFLGIRHASAMKIAFELL